MVVEIVFPLYYVQDPDIYTFVEDSWRWEHDFKAHISNHRHLYFKALFHFVFPIILDVHCPSIVQMCFSVWRWIDNQYLVATCGDLWRLPCLPEAPISLTDDNARYLHLHLREPSVWNTLRYKERIIVLSSFLDAEKTYSYYLTTTASL